MNLTISRETITGQGGCFGSSSPDYKVKARLNASEEECRIITKHSLEYKTEITRIPNKYATNGVYQPFYLVEILNKDWEISFPQMEQAAKTEQEITEACKGVKARMQYGESGGTKNIEL
jgi:hypothetical protein